MFIDPARRPPAVARSFKYQSPPRANPELQDGIALCKPGSHHAALFSPAPLHALPSASPRIAAYSPRQRIRRLRAQRRPTTAWAAASMGICAQCDTLSISPRPALYRRVMASRLERKYAIIYHMCEVGSHVNQLQFTMVYLNSGTQVIAGAVTGPAIAHSVAMIVYRSEGASEHLHTALHIVTYTQYTMGALRT